MGTTLGYICTACEHAFESSDGKDRGFSMEVQSMTCGDCRNVVDVVIGPAESAPGEMRTELLACAGRCPECDGTSLTEWYS